MTQKYVITIGRQLGSGGRQIGKQLAQQLGISFYDKELIKIAAQESGLGKEFFENADEKPGSPFLGGFWGMPGTYFEELYPNNYLSNEMLFNIQSDVIRKLADEKSCIFVGRCADYVLKDYPNCLNIFITANIDDRVKRISIKEPMPQNKAIDLIQKTDKNRSSYYNYFSNKTWGHATSYHLCINSSVFGIDHSVDFIKQIVPKLSGLNRLSD